MTDLKQKILNDLRVELSDEFDRNFQRKAFFDQSWPPRKMRNHPNRQERREQSRHVPL